MSSNELRFPGVTFMLQGVSSILHVVPFVWDHPASKIPLGFEEELKHAVWQLAQQQVIHGHQVSIMAPAFSGVPHLLLGQKDTAHACFTSQQIPSFIATKLEDTQKNKTVLSSSGAAKQLESFLTTAAIDICHVHEPVANSLATAVLRNAYSITVCSLYLNRKTSELRKVQQLKKMILSRADDFITLFAATQSTVNSELGRDCHLIHPGSFAKSGAKTTKRQPVQLLYVDGEERGSFRRLLKVLAKLVEIDTAFPWEITVISKRERSITNTRIAEKMRFLKPEEAENTLYEADICLGFSQGTKPTPLILLQLTRQGTTPVLSDTPLYREYAKTSKHGCTVDPHEITAFATQLARTINNPQIRQRSTVQDSWQATAKEVQTIYESLLAKRRSYPPQEKHFKQLATKPRIDVDLHMHTNHSYDCATPVDTLLQTAKNQGFGAIAVTDHNEISGAFEAAQKAEKYGVKVIVAEEIKTATQGEVIGLFLKEKIERGMTLRETVAEIKRQGGLVYVPHPFDRLHSIPDYDNLREIIADIDAIEIFNARVAISSFNDEAKRFARKYNIPAGAGSDAHVPQGLGSVRIRMHDFEGPQEFLTSLQKAEIICAPASLFYVQALKFWQTKARPR